MGLFSDLRSFSKHLESGELTPEFLKSALEPISQSCHFSRITTCFSSNVPEAGVQQYGIPPHMIAQAGPSQPHETVLFWDAARDSEHPEKVSYTSVAGPGKTVEYTAYSDRNADWDDDLRDMIALMLENLALHLSNSKLADEVRTAYSTQYLSGLPNSSAFMQRIYKMYADKSLFDYAAIFFNLQGFGLIDQRYGQHEGDAIIRRCAQILINFRKPDELVTHFGGDNFAVIIHKESVPGFLELLSGIHTYAEQNGNQIPLIIPAVAGVYMLDSSLEDPGFVIERCSTALAVARHIAKRPYVYVTQDILDRISNQKAIRAAFPIALANEEFVVYYQPKVDTETFRLVGAEALCRWKKNGSIVPPMSFIPIIENDGSVCDLDLYVLEHTCRDMARWKEQGIPLVPISVNFSRKDISRPDLPQRILEIIDRYGIDHPLIQVEVTETTSEDEHATMVSFLNFITSHNIDTAIDDFGTGFSSLSTIRDLSVNTIKIDKSFIDKEHFNPKDEVILNNIINMANELKIGVITEGVENWRQVMMLHRFGCHMVQGFLFDRPMPAEQFVEKLKKDNYDGE